MHRSQIAFSIILAISFFSSCRDNPVTIENNVHGFHAKVVDSNNNPVADVGFQYIFFVGENVVARNYSFKYSHTVFDTVTLTIHDPFGNQIAMPLNKEPQLAGYYMYVYDTSTLPNGVYSCTIVGSTFNQIISFFVLTDDIVQLKAMKPLMKSDAGGVIQLSYTSLGIGKQFLYENGSALIPLTVSDSIVVLFNKQGYKDYLEGIKLDTTKYSDITFRLQSN